MREQTKTFVRDFLDTHGSFARVLDLGSRDINGTVKQFFETVEYIGADMIAGGNVDVVVNGHTLTERFEKDSFDLVLCFDTLEHDDRFWLTVDQLKQVLKPGGYMLLGMPSRHCPEHDWPGDYWRFMPQSMTEFFFQGFEDVFTKVDMDTPNGSTEDELYGYGRKPIQQ